MSNGYEPSRSFYIVRKSTERYSLCNIRVTSLFHIRALRVSRFALRTQWTSNYPANEQPAHAYCKQITRFVALSLTSDTAFIGIQPHKYIKTSPINSNGNNNNYNNDDDDNNNYNYNNNQ